MDFNLLIAFIGSSVLLTVMPGPDNIFVLIQSITKGSKTGIIISIGLVSGLVVHTTIAATGLSLLLQQSVFIYQAILYTGALYLLFLAYNASQEKPILLENLKDSQYLSEWQRLIRTGFFMNVLNPKVTLFFIAFFPQFITKEGWPVPLQFSVLGFSFLVQAIIIFSIISAVAGRLSPYLNSPFFWIIAKWVKVSILIGLAVFLIIELN